MAAKRHPDLGPGRAQGPPPDAPASTEARLYGARAVLALHRWDPGTARCAACAMDCPCPQAVEAARLLAGAGAWDLLGFDPPAAPRPLPSPRARGAVTRAWHRVRRVLRRRR